MYVLQQNTRRSLKDDYPWSRLLVAMTIFGVCLFISGLAASVSRMRFPKGDGCPWELGAYCNYYDFPPNATNPPLPDILFSVVPMICDANANFPSYLLLVFMILTLVCLMVFDSQARAILARFCILDSFMLLLRSVSISMTQLNNPCPQCANCGSTCPDNWWDSIVQTFEYPYPLGTCGDSMFSGHTLHYMLMAYTWQTYMRITHPSWSPVFERVAWTITYTGIFSLISCRSHYTDDIFISYVITTFAWNFYSYFLNHLPTENISTYPYITQFIAWIERI
eukprot:TRINITY_DN4156_c0_g1_i1.p1 TRINITY_DN4156_c0_g1~~TRINITY_DN4156_c0_g1_i1.p1  ORF type:complete len:280 (+),score=31.20 TRINITY_DN4156_c0_g1_i1:129-968(+)